MSTNLYYMAADAKHAELQRNAAQRHQFAQAQHRTGAGSAHWRRVISAALSLPGRKAGAAQPAQRPAVRGI